VAERLKYSNFARQIDVEAWEDEIGFEAKFVKDGKKGQEALGHCLDPWGQHKTGDSTGKLAINRDERLFNCWVCGGGSLLSYTMAVKDWDEETATDWLYQFTRPIEATHEEFVSEIDRLLFEEKQAKPVLPWFNERVLDKWLGPHDAPNELYDWMKERGIAPTVLDQMKVGLNPEYTAYSSKGNWTGPAIIFPHFWNGRLAGWQARLDDSRPKGVKKYDNTNDFPRYSTIYNYEGVYLAKQPIVVVESVPTVLFLLSHGYPAVATFGGSVTPEQVRLLRVCHQGVIVAPDNDHPGEKFEEILVSGLERFVDVRLCERVPGEGSDLGDLADVENGVQILHMLLAEAAIPGF
jgi:hypothetical protein